MSFDEFSAGATVGRVRGLDPLRRQSVGRRGRRGPGADGHRDGSGVPLFHLADGGYVDNGGIGTAAEWLASALDAGPKRRVALVEVDAVVSEKQGEDHGWPYQLVAPLGALLAIRTQAPRERNEFALRLLQTQWKSAFQRFCFRYEADENPLSWHLSPEQQRKIRDAWMAPRNQAEVSRLRRFLAGAEVESSGRPCT